MKWITCLGLLTACGAPDHHLVVYNEYVCEDYLASSWVGGTPDPRRCEGFAGQQLIIRWNLPPGTLYGVEEPELVLRLRFRDHTQECLSIPMKRFHGTYVYWLLNEDYCDKGGVLTYKVDIVLDGEIFDCWQHQIWTELIAFDEQ